MTPGFFKFYFLLIFLMLIVPNTWFLHIWKSWVSVPSLKSVTEESLQTWKERETPGLKITLFSALVPPLLPDLLPGLSLNQPSRSCQFCSHFPGFENLPLLRGWQSGARTCELASQGLRLQCLETCQLRRGPFPAQPGHWYTSVCLLPLLPPLHRQTEVPLKGLHPQEASPDSLSPPIRVNCLV